MIECLFIGDSIAVGVATYATECQLQGKIGITSSVYANTFTVKESKTTIISLGSNDIGYDPYDDMKRIRETILHDVIWLISANSKEGAIAALRVANEYGDTVVDVSSVELSSDGVHPSADGLRQLANTVIK